MSNVIDNEVVRMQFDNAQFESGVKTSMSTIEKLKASLNFDAAKDSFKQIDKAAGSVDFSKMEKSLSNLESKFSVIGIAWAKVIMDMTAKVEHFAKSITTNLTVVPLKAGLQEYETQIDSVQTIMANTGRNVKDVNAALDELNEYADLTIYNFSQMTSNVGKFTAAIGKTPGGLEKSTQAIKGIGNWAAFAGANATQMATATYQLSQALGAGAIKLQDWRSVENASMAGMNFQEAFKETAREMGIAVDAAIAKEGTFRNSLKEGWLTTEVFFKTMEKFANDPDMTDAATKVKTFTQLIDVLKEALGTGWATTWRNVIGDFEEAKAFFTSVSDMLTGIISKTNDSRNKVIGEWASGLKDIAELSGGHAFGKTNFWGGDSGRADLIKSLENMTNAFATLIGPAKEAWDVVFGPLTSDSLKALSQKVEDFTHSLILNVEAQSDVKRAFIGIFTVLKTLVGILGSVLNLLGSVLKALSPIILILLRVAAVIGIVIKALLDAANEINIVGKIFEGIKLIAAALLLVLARLFEVIKNNAVVQSIIGKIATSFEHFLGVLNGIRTGAINKFLDLLNKIKKIFFDFTLGSSNKKSGGGGGGFDGEIHDIQRSVMVNNSKLADLAKTGRLEIDKSSEELEETEEKHRGILGKVTHNFAELVKTTSKASSAAVSTVKDSATGVVASVKSLDMGSLMEKLKAALAVGVVVAGVSAICAAFVKLSQSFTMLGESAAMAGEAAKVSLTASGLTYFVGFLKNFAISAALCAVAIMGIKYAIDNYFWDVRDTILDSVDTAYEGVETSVNKAKTISEKIKDAITEIYNSSNFASRSLGENIKILLSIGMFIGVLGAATTSMYNLSKAAGGFGEGLEAVGKGIRNYLSGKALDEMSDALYAFGVAMLSVAGSMWIIASIDDGAFKKAAITVGVIAVALVAIFTSLTTVNKKATEVSKAAKITGEVVGDDKKGVVGTITKTFTGIKSGLVGFAGAVKQAVMMTAQIAAISIGLLSFVGALWLFTEVLDKYSKLNPDEVTAGFLNMAGPLLALTAAVMALGLAAKDANFFGMGLTIISFTGALFLMIGVAKKFSEFITADGELNETAAMGCVALAQAMLALSVSIGIVGASTKKALPGLLGASVFLTTFIASLYAFIGAAKLIEKVNSGFGKAVKALIAMGAVFGALATALSIFNKGYSAIKNDSEGNLIESKKSQSFAATLLAAGASILAISAALLVFAKAAKDLSKVSEWDILKANYELAAMAVGMAVFGKAVSKLNWKPMLAFGIMMSSFVGSLYVLKLINIKDIGKGVAVLGTVIASLLVVSKLAGNKEFKMGFSTLAGIALDMIALSASLFALQFISWETIGKSIAAFIPILAGIGLCAKMAASGNDNTAEASFKGMAASIVSMTLSLLVLAQIPAKDLLTAALAIDMVGGIMAVIFAIVGKIKETPTNVFKTLWTLVGQMMLLIGEVVAATYLLKDDDKAAEDILAIGTMVALLQGSVVASLWALSKFDIKDINKKILIPLIGVVSGIAILGGGLAYAASKMGNNDKAVYALGTMASLLGVVTALVTKIIQIPSGSALNSAAGTFVTIGIVMAAVTGLMAWFSTFTDADKYVKLVAGAVITVAAIGTAVNALSPVAKTIWKNTHWIVGAGVTIGLFAAEISSTILLVLAAIGGITSSGIGESINNGINFIKNLAIKIAECFGDIVEAFSGGVIDTFVYCIDQIGSALTRFVSEIGGIKFADILNGGALVVLGVMIAMAGLLSNFIELMDPMPLDTLSFNIKSLGKTLKDFSESVEGVDSSAVQESAEALLYLFLALALSPREGGLIDIILGNNNSALAGFSLAIFGKKLAEYAKSIGTISNWDTVKSANSAITDLFKALKEAPNEGGLISLLTGNNQMSKVAPGIKDLGETMANYATNLSEITNWGTVKSANSTITDLFKALKDAPNSGGLIGIIIGNNDDLVKIGDNLVTFAWKLVAYGNNLAEVADWKLVSDSTDEIKKIFETLQEAPIQDALDRITGVNDVDAAGDSLGWFGENLVDFAESLAEVNDWELVHTGIDTMIEVFEALEEFPDDLPGLFANSERGATEGAKFSDGMHQLGRGMKRFAKALDDVDSSNAIAATQMFCDLIVSLNNIDMDDLEDIYDSTDLLLEIAENINKFFESFNTNAKYDTAVEAINKYADAVRLLGSNSVKNVTISTITDGFDEKKSKEIANGINGITNSILNLNGTIKMGGKISGGGTGGTGAMARIGLPTTHEIKNYGKTLENETRNTTHNISEIAKSETYGLTDWLVDTSGDAGTESGDEYSKNLLSSVKKGLGELKSTVSNGLGSALDWAKGSDNPLVSAIGEKISSVTESPLFQAITSGDYSGFAEFNIFGDIKDQIEETMDSFGDIGGDFEEEDKKKKQKKLLSENKYWAELLEIKKQGADAYKYIDMDLADFQESILKDYTDLMDDFMDEYKSKNKEMSDNMLGMKEVSMFKDKNGKTDYEFTDNDEHMDWKKIQQNLYDQELAARRYTNAMRLINERVSNESLLKELNDLGIDDLEYLEVVANLSDKQLQEFESRSVNILTQGHEAAAQAMFSQSKELESQANKLLGTDLNIDQLTQMWNGMMSSLDEMVAADQAKLAESGTHVVEGIAEGIIGDASQVAIGTAIRQVGDDIPEEFDDEMGIESPSRKMKPHGEFVTAGIAVGMDPKKDSMARLVLELASRNTADAIFQLVRKAVQDKEFGKIGEYIVQGISNGMNNNKADVFGAITGIANKINSTFRKPLKIESPSKVFEENGMYIDMGLANGIENNSGLVESATGNLANTALASMQAAIAVANSSLLGEAGPSITPVWNSESIQNGIDSMDNALMSQRAFLMANAAAANMDTSINKTIAIDNHQAVDAITKLNNDMLALEERIGSLQVVLNSGVLVGEMAPGMNSELGSIAIRGLREGAG